MSFSLKQKVLFKHCDPAGIVFYPRYFEMINDSVEEFFDSALDMPFEKLLEVGGVPTAQISAKFVSPSRHGDILDIELNCKKLGQSSLDLTLKVSCDEATRLSANSTLVYVDLSGRPAPWPEKLRVALEAQIEGEV